jgi:pyruvate/2-oxoglutarate dehydrogenase complex dihydrolipoamide acyltransferase (E2) component
MRTEVVFLSESEAVEFGAVNSWLFAVGDRVEVGQPLVEVEAEKVIMEIPAPVSGVLIEVLAEEGDEVIVGGALGVIEGED